MELLSFHRFEVLKILVLLVDDHQLLVASSNRFRI